MVETDFGMMAIPAKSKLSEEGTRVLALRRYSRGESLATLSRRVMTERERLSNG